MGCTPIFKYVPLVRIHVQSHTLMTLKFVIAVVSTSRRRRDARSARERPKALAFTARARESSRARSPVDAVAEHLRTDPIGIGILKHIRYVRRDLEDGGADGSRER